MSIIFYVEEFIILGHHYGIEEGGRPDPEYPHHTDRFRAWTGPELIGHTKTLDQARKQVHQYARQRAADQQMEAVKRLNEAKNALAALDDDPRYLVRFEVRR